MAEDKTTHEKNTDRVLSQDGFANWFKNNLENLVLIILCLIFTFRGFASITKTGKTVFEIIADGTLSFIVGFVIKNLMHRKGILKGLISDKFISTTNTYGDKKAEICDFVEELDPFCNKKNAERLKQAQKEFLLKHSMNYNLFIEGKYEESDILKQCRNISVFKYTSVLLTNAYDNTSSEEELLTTTIKGYERKQRLGDFGIGLVTFILFGYYTLKPNGLDWNSVLWCAVQVSLFLANGMIKHMNAYYFVTETLRGKIKRVVDILDEFINIRSKNPDIFRITYDTDPINLPLPTLNIIHEPIN